MGPDDGGDLTLAELEADPYPSYRRLRESGVVWVEAAKRWFVTRWDDVAQVETTPGVFTAREENSLQTRVMGLTMLRSDGDAHRRLRRAAQDPLRPNAVEERWRVDFQRIADELVDDFVGDGEGDLFERFAAPFAARSLGVVLGLTDTSDERLMFWSQALMDGTSNYGDDVDTWKRSERAAAEIDAAVDQALKDPRPTLDGSVIQALAARYDDVPPLSPEEIHANVKLIIGGGLNEPRDGLAIALWGLLTHHDQAALAIADPSLWPRAAEEAFRWVSPLAMFPRQVAQPVRLADTDLYPGARLGLIVASANRDERQWQNPDAFDITRPKRRNVAFGVGHHFCLGVWMARSEIGEVALPTLFRRLPNLRFNLDRPPRMQGWVFRGPLSLHARWDA